MLRYLCCLCSLVTRRFKRRGCVRVGCAPVSREEGWGQLRGRGVSDGSGSLPPPQPAGEARPLCALCRHGRCAGPVPGGSSAARPGGDAGSGPSVPALPLPLARGRRRTSRGTDNAPGRAVPPSLCAGAGHGAWRCALPPGSGAPEARVHPLHPEVGRGREPGRWRLRVLPGRCPVPGGCSTSPGARQDRPPGRRLNPLQRL